MPRTKKTDDVTHAAGAEAQALEAAGIDKKGACYRAITTKLATERLKRLKQQNEKLNLELRRLKGHTGDPEKIRREVLTANATVKLQILAVPPRLSPQLAAMTDVGAINELLTEALSACMNDLAYERNSINR